MTAHEHAEPVPGTVTQEEPGSRPIEPDAEHETVLDVVDIPRGTGTAYSTVSPDGHRLYLGIGSEMKT